MLLASVKIMKIGVITPIGPGHEKCYEICKKSILNAWETHPGPFSELEIIEMPDLEGYFGRSSRRNAGIDLAHKNGCDWLFFLDADDIMAPLAFRDINPYLQHFDAIWGNIYELEVGSQTNDITSRKNQLVTTEDLDDILNVDPYLSLQMGHFVRTSCALKIKFDEMMDAGEDFRYYLKVWSQFRCKKTEEIFFINIRGNSSAGPRSADGNQWRIAVESEIQKVKSLRASLKGTQK